MKSALLRIRAMNRDNLLALIMIPFYTVGLIGHIVEATRPLILSLSPYFLLIFGALALLPPARERRPGVLLWAVGTLVVSFALEAVGTATGVPFGPYTYGTVLGVHLLRVPVVIAFNWVIVILGAVILSRRITSHPLLAAVIAGAAAVLFDFIMEPVAVALDYWTWHAPTIPLQNYGSWFAIALLSALAFNLSRLSVRSLLPAYYVGIQTVFFLVLRFTAA